MFICKSIRQSNMIFSDRCNYYVEFLHNVQRIPFHFARRFELNGYERMGRGVHVFHLRLAAGIRVRQLRG